MKAIITSIILLFAIKGVAQRGIIQGKILDKNSKEPLEYAIVAVYNAKDSLLNGGLAKSNGDFQVDRLPQGNLKVKISFVGYNTQQIQVVLTPGQAVKDIGNVKLEMSGDLLKGVEIESEKSTVQIGIDRRIYNVEKDLSARGGTAIDAMKNIPGLTVGLDNSVTLRNQNPTVFVDGRPTLMTLDQIPADDIERIEVITNPSAKYVADATGGIINVIMKKNLKPGYFGNITAGIGTGDRYNLNSSISIREKNLTVQLSGGYYNALNNNNGLSYRENILSGRVLGGYDQDNLNASTRNGFNSRLQVDYKTSVRSLLSASLSYSDNDYNSSERQDYFFFDSLEIKTADGYRQNEQINNWKTFTAGINYKKAFAKAGKELTSDLSLTSSWNENNADYRTFDNATATENAVQLKQLNTGKREADLLTFQLDMVDPRGENARLEYGARASYKLSYSDFLVQYEDQLNNSTLLDSGLSNNLRIDDFVGAAYVNYAGMWKGIGYQAGLRYEHTWFVGELTNTGETFNYIYPKSIKEIDKVLFPAIYLSKKIKDKHEFQMNYSRKIGRPGFMQLIPFIMYADRQSVQIGNPVLGPEFINLGEVNYSFTGNKGSLLTSIYARQTLYSITPIVYTSEIDPEILISSYVNGRDKLDLGWETTIKRSITKWLDFTTNANLFYTKVSLEQGGTIVNNEGFSWNIKGMLSVKASKKLNFQWNGNYEAPRIIPQGKVNPIWFMDFSCSYTFNKKFSASATLSDAFNTKQYGTFYSTDNFTQRNVRRWESRYFRVNLTWKFGEPDVSIFRRRSGGRREPGSGGTEMEM